MLQRKALKQFQAWHDAPSHTALLVTGARQVGKPISFENSPTNIMRVSRNLISFKIRMRHVSSTLPAMQQPCSCAWNWHPANVLFQGKR